MVNLRTHLANDTKLMFFFSFFFSFFFFCGVCGLYFLHGLLSFLSFLQTSGVNSMLTGLVQRMKAYLGTQVATS